MCVWDFKLVGEGFCSCGIVIRVENFLYVYCMCVEIFYCYGEEFIYYDIVYYICDDYYMVIKNEFLWIKVKVN